MSVEEGMLNRLLHCTIANGYEGLEEFKSFALQHPDVAMRIAWKVLTNREDPGRDDGVLSAILLETISDTSGRDAVESLILAEWTSLTDGLRRNVTAGACSLKAMSTEFGIKLFGLAETRVEQRHHILARFLAGDRNRRCEGFIVELATRIGTYDEPHRQRILERFVQDINRNYG